MSPSVRRALNLAGLTLGMAGVVFVGLRLHSHLSSAETDGLGKGVWITVALLSLLCAANSFLLGVAWRLLLIRAGAEASWRWSIRTYGITQLAKYVPGNIFQFAGRQSLGVAAGLGGRPLAKSTAFELISLSAAGTLFGLLLLSKWLAVSELGACVIFAASSVLAICLTRGALGRQAAAAFMAHLAYLAITGVAFAVLLAAVSAGDTNFTFSVGAFVVGWLLGLLTPGSPAGLGIRETILLTLLTDLNEASVVQAVVLGRLVSVVGDAGYFLSAWFVPQSSHA